jgi:hypothetical protein
LGGGDGGALPCGELRWFISGWRGEREGLLVSHGATWRVGASLGGAVGGGSALMAGACWGTGEAGGVRVTRGDGG